MDRKDLDAATGAERTRAVLDARAAVLARPPESEAEGTRLECVVVKVGDHRLAVPSGRAAQVAAPAPFARLPDAGSALVGVRAVGDDLVAVADLAALLGVQSDVPVADRWTLVLDGPGDPGLLVDAVDGVVDIASAALRAPSAGGDGLRFVLGIVDEGLLVLDVDAVLADSALRRSSPIVLTQEGAP